MEVLKRDKKFRRLSFRIVASSVFLLSIFFIKHFSIHQQLKKEQNISHTMNIVGQQRMLSQKLTKDLELLDQGRLDSRQEYIDTLDFYLEGQEELEKLAEKDQVFYMDDSYILGLLGDSKEPLDEIKKASNDYLKKMFPKRENVEERQEDLEEINHNSNLYLEIMENIVSSYEKANKESLISIQWANNLFFILAILLLIYISIGILYPIIQHSLSIYLKIKKVRKDLTEILTEMRGILFLVDYQGEILFLNQDAKKLLKVETKGDELLKIDEAVDWLNFDIIEFIRERGQGENTGEEIEVLAKNSSEEIVPLALSAVSGSFRDEKALILNMHDLTKQKEAEEVLKKLAIRDSLTGLYNRHFLETIIGQEFKRSDRYDLPLSLILLDLDHFKKVNDLHGHVIGDKVLNQTAQLILTNIQASDYAVRIGGEEIMLFLPNTKRKEAKTVAEKIRKIIETSSYPEVGQVTASFGVVEREKFEEYLSLYYRVDKALYQAKSQGRNCVVDK